MNASDLDLTEMVRTIVREELAALSVQPVRVDVLTIRDACSESKSRRPSCSAPGRRYRFRLTGRVRSCSSPRRRSGSSGARSRRGAS